MNIMQFIKHRKVIIGTIIAVLVVGTIVYYFINRQSSEHTIDPSSSDSALTAEELEQRFRGFETDTSKTSIDLSQVLSGGPGKDGIPAISDPEFVPIGEAEVDPSVLGILIEIDGEKRYYPFNILVWHEIVNDQIGETYFSVTFCPLCGSAIVFDRTVLGDVLEFRVSGKLYESNLLMYDTGTESFWSQALGEAVIGDYSGTKLELLPFQRISFEELQANHLDAKVLSRNTGYNRNYDSNPYGNYGETDNLVFPVSVDDNRFFAKEIMYVIPIENKSIAFPLDDIENNQQAKFNQEGIELTVTKENDEITVTKANGEIQPGYFEMWFSWATHHQESGIVWNINE